MKKILIVGAGSSELEITKLLKEQGISKDDIIIVNKDNIKELTLELTKQTPIKNFPSSENPTILKKELYKHPFEKFIGTQKWKK